MKRLIVICLVAVLFVLTGQVFGLTQYKDGGTHNISTTVNDDVWVDYQTPGMNTTVNLTAGCNIPSPHKLEGFGNSILNMSGGSVYWMEFYNNAQVGISGGQVNLDFFCYDNTQLTISGGHLYGLETHNNTRLTMSGGSVGTYFYAQDNTQVVMSGGSFNFFDAHDNSEVELLGGTITGGLRMNSFANAIISGSDFAIDGSPVGCGDITSILGGPYSNEPYRTLTGNFDDGVAFSYPFVLGDHSSITLVPEPSTMAMLISAITAGGLFLRRRK